MSSISIAVQDVLKGIEEEMELLSKEHTQILGELKASEAVDHEKLDRLTEIGNELTILVIRAQSLMRPWDGSSMSLKSSNKPSGRYLKK